MNFVSNLHEAVLRCSTEIDFLLADLQILQPPSQYVSACQLANIILIHVQYAHLGKNDAAITHDSLG